MNPKRRLGQIAKRSAGLELVASIPSSRAQWLERIMHEAFSHRRIGKEWFKLEPADVEIFQAVPRVDHEDELPANVVELWQQNSERRFRWKYDPEAFRPIADIIPWVVCLMMPRDLVRAMNKYLRATKGTVTHHQFFNQAVTEYLGTKGFWPPPATKG